MSPVLRGVQFYKGSDHFLPEKIPRENVVGEDPWTKEPDMTRYEKPRDTIYMLVLPLA